MENMNCYEDLKDERGCGVTYNFYNCCKCETGDEEGNNINGESTTGSCECDNLEMYSEEEMICGEWIDGKPIYRKVIVGTTAASAGPNLVLTNVTGLNIERVIRLYGNLIDNNGNTQIQLPVSYAASSSSISYAINTWYNSSSKDISYALVGNLYTSCQIYIVLEYTKA